MDTLVYGLETVEIFCEYLNSSNIPLYASIGLGALSIWGEWLGLGILTTRERPSELEKAA